MAFFNIDRVETGNRIYAARKELHLTQEELAWRVGVSTVTFGRWERGEIDISQPNAKSLAAALGRQVYELIVAELNYFGDERDQLVPLIISNDIVLTSIWYSGCSFFCQLAINGINPGIRYN